MMCFTAGANAVFTGEKMLTTDCNGWDEDKDMFQRWGLRPMASQHDAKDTMQFTSTSWQDLNTPDRAGSQFKM
jgi:biotin synthase